MGEELGGEPAAIGVAAEDLGVFSILGDAQRSQIFGRINQNLMENLFWTLLKAPNRRSIYQTTMGLLFMLLLNYTDRLVSRSTEEAAIVKVLRYIEENYPTGSLTEIAEALHYDLCWLSREIKRRTGKNFKELLQEKRLTQAAYFLKHTRLHVDEIGEAVGYSNLSYFHRIFQEKFGVTPKKYRDS